MWCNIWLVQFYTLLLAFIWKCGACVQGSGLVHVQTFNGDIGASNFTYYKLTLEGHVVVCLHSFVGDADLYLSTETLKPTWEDYTMKSDTCSDDVVIVQDFHQRPVGIGVYGYINSYLSTFQLSVYIDESKQNYYPEEKPQQSQGEKQQGFNSKDSLHSDLPPGEEESLVWNIFVGFLKVLFDILI